MAAIIETKKLSNGVYIRLQRHGKDFSVIRNTTGYCWMYVEKKVSEDRARNTFALLTMA